MKQSKSVVLVLLALVATPLLLLSGAVSAQSYGEGAYGGRTYNNWLVEDQDQETPPSGGSQEDTSESPGVVVIPEDDENDDSDDLQIDSPDADEIDLSVDRGETVEQPGDEEEEQRGSSKTPSLAIYLSIGAVLLALLLILLALLRRRRREVHEQR